MIKKCLGLTLLVIAMAMIALVWYSQQLKQLPFTVNNKSAVPVETLRVFGSALSQEIFLVKLEPGDTQTLQLNLAAKGSLKYEISQGLTRADTFIVKDVSQLEVAALTLTITADNRFIISKLNVDQ